MSTDGHAESMSASPAGRGPARSDVPPRPLVIAGIPRSGTTWTKQVLECDPSTLSMMEPDSEGHRAPAIWAKRSTGRFPVLSPGDRAQDYRTLWAWILDGAAETPRLRVAAKILATVTPPDRKRFLQGRHSLKMEVSGLLGRRPPIRPAPGLEGRRVLVKTVHAPMSIDWLASEFAIDVLVVVRHPLSILASWIDLDYNDQYVPFHEIAAVRRRAEAWDVPPPGPDHFDRMVWQIAVLLTALEESAAANPTWTVRTHEELCVDPAAEFTALFDALGLQWSDAAEAVLEGNDRPGSGFRTQRVAADLPSAWRRRLSAEQIERAERILRPFPLTGWSTGEFDGASG